MLVLNYYSFSEVSFFVKRQTKQTLSFEALRTNTLSNE